MRLLLPLAAVSVLAAALLAPAPPLPPAVRREVDAAYPGWKFATVSPALRHLLAPGQRPEWVSGDFDGDGRRDYAVQLVRATPRADSAQLTVALLRRRGDGWARHVVSAGPVHDGVWLGRGRRGTRARDLDGDTNFVYHADAIEIGFGQEAGEACLYARGRFRCVITGD
jgi:hypothetical protein